MSSNDALEDLQGGFQYVESSSNRSRRRKRGTRAFRIANDLSPSCPLRSLATALDCRRETFRKVNWLALSNAWLNHCITLADAPTPIRKILCLALGSFSPPTIFPASELNSTSPVPGFHAMKQSQYQLVFLLDVIIPTLKAKSNHFSLLENPESPMDQLDVKVEFYDPAFTEADKGSIRGLGYYFLEQEPDLKCQEPTLIYMPHAPKTLYEKLVQANSGDGLPGNLCRVLLLGNTLRTYMEELSQDQQNFRSLSSLKNTQVQVRYPPELCKLHRVTGVQFFSDISLQWFPEKILSFMTADGSYLICFKRVQSGLLNIDVCDSKSREYK